MAQELAGLIAEWRETHPYVTAIDSYYHNMKECRLPTLRQISSHYDFRSYVDSPNLGARVFMFKTEKDRRNFCAYIEEYQREN